MVNTCFIFWNPLPVRRSEGILCFLKSFIIWLFTFISTICLELACACRVDIKVHFFSYRYTVYSFPRAVLTKYHKLGGLRQQEVILSKLRRPDAWNQGVGRVMLPLKALRTIPSSPLPSFWWWLEILDIPCFVSTSSDLCLHCHIDFFPLYLCV